MDTESYNKKLVSYATAPKAYAEKITQIIDGNFVDCWIGKLRGNYVSMGGNYKFKNRDDAVNLAREYRKYCKDEAIKRGLM